MSSTSSGATSATSSSPSKRRCKEIRPLESSDSKRVMVRMTMGAILPTPECAPPTAGVDEPVRMNCPGSPRRSTAKRTASHSWIVTNSDKYPRFSRHTVTIYDAVKDGHQVDIEELRDLFDAMTFAQAYECRFFADELCLLQPDEVRAVFDEDCLRYVSAWVNGGVDIGRTKDVGGR